MITQAKNGKVVEYFWKGEVFLSSLDPPTLEIITQRLYETRCLTAPNRILAELKRLQDSHLADEDGVITISNVQLGVRVGIAREHLSRSLTALIHLGQVSRVGTKSYVVVPEEETCT